MYCADNTYKLDASKEREVIHPYVFASEDGYRWSAPTRAYDKNYWLWRVQVHDGVFYCAEKGGELLSSPNSQNWTFVSRIPDDEGKSPQELKELREVEHRMTPQFNEADVIFRPDGELWCVSRTKREPSQHSLLYISSPPYKEWSCVDLKAMIHCPALCEVGGQVYVAGRRDPTTPWISQHSPAGNTGIFRLDREGLTPVLALSSDGDAAYPGLVSVETDRLTISYYSQHAYLSGVVEGEKRRYHHMVRWGNLRRQAPPPDYPDELAHHTTGPADIFVAEIDLAADNEATSF